MDRLHSPTHPGTYFHIPAPARDASQSQLQDSIARFLPLSHTYHKSQYINIISFNLPLLIPVFYSFAYSRDLQGHSCQVKRLRNSASKACSGAARELLWRPAGIVFSKTSQNHSCTLVIPYGIPTRCHLVIPYGIPTRCHPSQPLQCHLQPIPASFPPLKAPVGRWVFKA